MQREISVVVFHFSSPDVAAPLMFDRQPEQESQLDSTFAWHLGSHRFTHLTCVHMSFRFLTLKSTTRMSPAKPEQHDQLPSVSSACWLIISCTHLLDQDHCEVGQKRSHHQHCVNISSNQSFSCQRLAQSLPPPPKQMHSTPCCLLVRRPTAKKQHIFRI